MMVFNKKMVIRNLSAVLILALAVESAHARFTAQRSTGNSDSTSGQIVGGVNSITSAENNVGIVGKGVGLEECTYDYSKSQYFPLTFFRDISRNGEDIGFEMKGTRIVINIPPTLGVCGKLNPTFLENPETGNVTIAMEMLSDRNQRLTYGDFEKCLKERNLLTDKGVLDHDKIDAGFYYSKPFEYQTHFNKTKDADKTATVTFAYPVAFSDPKTGYPTRYADGIFKGIRVPNSTCLLAEKVGERNLYINEGKELLLDRISHICRNGTVDEIQDLKKSLANFPQLQGVIEELTLELTSAELDKVWEGRSKEIFNEMAKIEAAIKSHNENGGLDEATIIKHVTKYTKLVEELDRIFIDPSITYLNELLLKRERLDDPSKELDELDEEIKKINNYIGEYANAKTTGRITNSSVFDAARKVGLVAQGSAIITAHHKSFYFSRVYEGPHDTDRGEKLTFLQANEKTGKQHTRAKKILDEDYQVKTVRDGSIMPLKVTEKEFASLARSRQRMEYDIQKREATMLQESCAPDFFGRPKNASRCQYLQRTAPRRQALARRRIEKMDARLDRTVKKLDKLRTARGDFEAKRFEESEDREDEDSYYSDLDDSSFREDYFYTGNSGYAPHNYSMLGYGQERNMLMYQQNPMMYQQNPMMYQQNPMMYNQYQQYGGMPYQMPPYQMQNQMLMPPPPMY